MGKNRRYSLTCSLYIYARNDNEAKVKSAQLIERLSKQEENSNAQSYLLDETPFASIASREVHAGMLTILNNKIIEKSYTE